MTPDFEIRLQALDSKIEPLQKFITAFSETFVKPIFYHSGQEHYGFRFGTPSVKHFCLLKAVRVVSALNAAVALARSGYAQEIAVLIRTLIEYTTHIEFVLNGTEESGALTPDVEKYVRDYFADFARNTANDFKRAQIKQATVNKRLAARLVDTVYTAETKAHGAELERVYSNMYLTYSSYVHAKYPEVMDMYGGAPEGFHLKGMRNTPKDEENIEIIDTFIDTASISFHLMVTHFRLCQLINSDPVLTVWFRGEARD